MSKEVLQITISKTKLPKSKLGKWLYWNLYWRVWKIWRPKFLAWFFKGLADFIYWCAPKSIKEKWDKEWDEEIKIVVKNEYNDLEL